jgi:hypothetical protein
MYFRSDFAVTAGMFINCPAQNLLLRIQTAYNVLQRNRVLHLFCTEVLPYVALDTSTFTLRVNGVPYTVAPAQLWLNAATSLVLAANTVNGTSVS